MGSLKNSQLDVEIKSRHALGAQVNGYLKLFGIKNGNMARCSPGNLPMGKA